MTDQTETLRAALERLLESIVACRDGADGALQEKGAAVALEEGYDPLEAALVEFRSAEDNARVVLATPPTAGLDVERLTTAWHWAFHRDRGYECSDDREMAERIVAADIRARRAEATND